MSRKLDLTGLSFGRLTARHPTADRSARRVVWSCDCACGRTDVRVAAGNLRQGRTESCGCLARERGIANLAAARVARWSPALTPPPAD